MLVVNFSSEFIGICKTLYMWKMKGNLAVYHMAKVIHLLHYKKVLLKRKFSGILRVTGSLGHQPSSKDLQNKQGTGSGVSAASRMLKSNQKLGEKVRQFISKVFESLLVVIPSLCMKEEDGQLFMESS